MVILKVQGHNMVRLLVSSFVKDTATKTRPIKVLLYYKLHHFIDWQHLILKRGLFNRFHLHCIIVAIYTLFLNMI